MVVACPECSTTYRLPSLHPGGVRVTCPHCQTRFVAVVAESEAPASSEGPFAELSDLEEYDRTLPPDAMGMLQLIDDVPVVVNLAKVEEGEATAIRPPVPGPPAAKRNAREVLGLTAVTDHRPQATSTPPTAPKAPPLVMARPSQPTPAPTHRIRERPTESISHAPYDNDAALANHLLHQSMGPQPTATSPGMAFGWVTMLGVGVVILLCSSMGTLLAVGLPQSSEALVVTPPPPVDPAPAPIVAPAPAPEPEPVEVEPEQPAPEPVAAAPRPISRPTPRPVRPAPTPVPEPVAPAPATPKPTPTPTPVPEPTPTKLDVRSTDLRNPFG